MVKINVVLLHPFSSQKKKYATLLVLKNIFLPVFFIIFKTDHCDI